MVLMINIWWLILVTERVAIKEFVNIFNNHVFIVYFNINKLGFESKNKTNIQL